MMLKVAILPPIAPQIKKIANVCNVKGIVRGIEIHEHNVMHAAENAQQVNSFVCIKYSFFCVEVIIAKESLKIKQNRKKETGACKPLLTIHYNVLCFKTACIAIATIIPTIASAIELIPTVVNNKVTIVFPNTAS